MACWVSLTALARVPILVGDRRKIGNLAMPITMGQWSIVIRQHQPIISLRLADFAQEWCTPDPWLGRDAGTALTGQE